MKNTIFAPATAAGKAGVAIVRVSGPDATAVFERFGVRKDIEPRKAVFAKLKKADGTPIDDAVVLYFKAPNSFTGEDVVELQTHGGRAVLSSVLAELSLIDGFRPADRGEFTRRAVENGKMDLTAAEGLADLVDAETEQQRKQALRQMNGDLGRLYDGWREELVRLLAWSEAYIDFPEEEIPADVSERIRGKITELKAAVENHLQNGKRGERLRDGFQIAIVGAPNAGKSSLMNRLADRDVAIVSSTAGTTRDVIEVRMDINGYPVVIADTAGLRQTDEVIEAEGVRRAKKRAKEADLILAVYDASAPVEDSETKAFQGGNVLKIMNKKDKVSDCSGEGLWISAKTGEGTDALLDRIAGFVENALSMREEPSLTRVRHRQSLEEYRDYLERSLSAPEIELAAEDLRLAMRALGKITGAVRVEELLDIIFKDFCIGK